MKIAPLAIAAVISFAPAFASPLLLVVPNAETNTAGNAGDGFGTGTGGSNESEEILGSGQFQSIPNDDDVLITQIAFRAAPNTGAVNVSISSLDIFLSTSPYYPNDNGGDTPLTDNFATNLGPDNTEVYSGAASFTSSGCTTTGSAACPFDMVFTFSTPFVYNPSAGRLLALTEASGVNSSGGTLDAMNFSFPPGGSVASLDGALGATTGTVSFESDIVQVGYTLISPEPGTLALAFSALLGGAAFVRKSGRAAKL